MPQKPTLSATTVIIAVCCIVFAAQYLAPYPYDYMIDNQALSTSVVKVGDWHTLVTSMFMHGGLQHLLCNMISLYWVGSILERAYGSIKFLVLYFVAGIAGGLAFVALNMGTNASAVGASGAIFGLFAAYVYLLIREHKKATLFTRPPARSDVTSMLVLLAINIAIGFTPGIAWQAHAGGFVAGIVVGAVLYEFEKARIKKLLANRGTQG